MKRQWEIYAIDEVSRVSFLVVSSDAVNAVFPYVSVVPVVRKGDGREREREVYPVEALLGDRVAMVHQIRTLRADRLTIRRDIVDDEVSRTAVKEAMAAYFGW
ncbi:MAG: type II toxin-antitoxin system PemK/MazF family toxin [Spirochaeta sp.]|jgi:mRNA-degrading endonuclease toxin of MazEF toxin-antitoxin module|nr:type II toxin-antitoxin system PemK/MazF family toxin [Spirochaeta sp.]